MAATNNFVGVSGIIENKSSITQCRDFKGRKITKEKKRKRGEMKLKRNKGQRPSIR